MTLKLKIIKAGSGFLTLDIGKRVEIVDVFVYPPFGIEEYTILVKSIEGVEYSTLENESSFGIANWVSPCSFGLTAKQIKEMLEKEKQKEESVEEFYKTIKVGDIVKVEGEQCGDYFDAVAIVAALYGGTDFGFDYKLVSGHVPYDKGTIGCSSLENGHITLSPVDKKEYKAVQDMVNSPNHYILFKGVEVKDVVKEVLRRWQDESDVEMSFNQAGMMKEALQYLLRAPKKNKKEDVEKAVYYLKAILEEWK